MGKYLGSVWRCRYFWLSLVKMDLRTRYRGSFLGIGWSLVHPLVMTFILCLVFGGIFNPSGSRRQYAAFLLAGLATWSYIRSVTLQGCQCFYNAESYIRQHPAPMAIYPLRTALAESVHFWIALLVVLGISWYSNGFNNLPYMAALAPALILLFLFVWSLAVLAGLANVYFKDTQQIAEVGFQILFYMTPIIYPARALKISQLKWLADYNPLVALLDLVRDPIVGAGGNSIPQMPSLATVALAGGSVVFAMSAAIFLLARLQRRLIFYL